MSPFGEDPDRFDTDNELEDGFSFVSEDADGFDSDAVGFPCHPLTPYLH